VVLGSRFLVLGSGRPRSQGARGSRFSVLGSRFGTSALPGGTWFSVPGSWFSVRDARAPGTRRIARMRARRPRTQDACGSRFLVPGSRFGTPAHPGTLRIARMRAGTPAHPGGMWFSVPGSWFSVRDARTPGTRRGRAHAGGTPALLARAGAAHMRAGRPRTQGHSPP
jgi:hypothetical protein